MSIKGLEQAIANLNSISEKAVPAPVHNLLTALQDRQSIAVFQSFQSQPVSPESWLNSVPGSGGQPSANPALLSA
jgi:hypothetical protein